MAKKLSLSGMFLALCVLLPFVTGQVETLGNALCPMHIPVLLCGFFCGWQYAAAVGAVAPILRFALFGMPPIFPKGISMAFELAAYGFFVALLYRALPKKKRYVYVSLVLAMLLGRIVWGITQVVIFNVLGGSLSMVFTFGLFLTEGFVNAIPGIIVQIVLIPVIVMAFGRRKARAEC